MTISTNGKTVSPRQRRAKLKGETTVEVENNQGHSSNQEQVEKGANLPVQLEKSNKQEVVGTLAVAGERPITSSDLEIAHTFSSAGIRPIGVSHLEVVETMNIMGIRPIGANTFQVMDSINLSGIRPISSSALVISSNYSVMGNRPVAPNETDDSDSLMGFID
jgi:hypothetical protein